MPAVVPVYQTSSSNVPATVLSLFAPGPWCGQHQSPPVPDDRLISGDWFVEGVREELDVPGEYHYDSDTRMLYYWSVKAQTV